MSPLCMQCIVPPGAAGALHAVRHRDQRSGLAVFEMRYHILVNQQLVSLEQRARYLKHRLLFQLDVTMRAPAD